MADLDWPAAYDIKPNPNVSEVLAGDRLVAKVHFVPGTVGHVYYIEIFDKFNNRVQRTDYDERGFKARDQFIAPNGEPVSDIFTVRMAVVLPNSITRIMVTGRTTSPCAN
ncbi:hypothetical protein [Lactiplantibacillus carotarum]|uniref:hypothetical protein n=1 Tax=Lactiplantibacillus carotarum TaxID=2993456 RepID=UPI00298EDA61|nr:hypothetical protein [Lactiplantibacillus carotarum]